MPWHYAHIFPFNHAHAVCFQNILTRRIQAILSHNTKRMSSKTMKITKAKQ